MRRVFIAIISLWILYGCGQQQKPGNTLTNNRVQNNLARFDTLFYPVYELSPTTIAVNIGVTNEKEAKSIFDTIFDKTDSLQYAPFAEQLKNCYYYDTTGAYKLFKNDNLQKEIKKHLHSTYYVYGTKGMTECNAKDVVFGGDECRSSILAFTVEKFDTNRYGHPVVCSWKLLKFNYGASYTTIEKKIDELINSAKADYTDSMKTIVFANIDSFYFTYNDDFLWGKIFNDGNCYFPSRGIFILQNNGEIKRYWTRDLDCLEFHAINCN